jgi:hypothetical protein
VVRNLGFAAVGAGVVLLSYYVLYVRHHVLSFSYLFIANLAGGHPMSVLEYLLALSRPFRKGWSIDNLFFVTAILAALGAFVLQPLRKLWRRPLFVFSELWIFFYALMMGLHNNSVPRYYAPMVPGLFFVGGILLETMEGCWPIAARVFLALVLIEAVANTAETLYFVARPTYTLLDAAEGVKGLVDTDPAVIISHNAFEITLFTGLPGINEDYGEEPIRQRVPHYHARWWVRQGYWDDGSLMSNAVGDQYRFVEAGRFPVFNHTPGYIVYRMVPIVDAKTDSADKK